MNIKITLVLASILFLGLLESRASDYILNKFLEVPYSDTMVKKVFFREVKKDMDKMRTNRNFTTDQAIRLVKLYNTLHLSNLYSDAENSKLIKKFFIIFKTKYSDKLIHFLKFGIGKNMSLYSIKYDLYMAPGTEIRNKDMILVK